MQAASSILPVSNHSSGSVTVSGCKQKTGLVLAAIGIANASLGLAQMSGGLSTGVSWLRSPYAYFTYAQSAFGLALSVIGCSLWACTRSQVQPSLQQQGILGAGERDNQLNPEVAQLRVGHVISQHVPAPEGPENLSSPIPHRAIQVFRAIEMPRWPPTIQERIQNPFMQVIEENLGTEDSILDSRSIGGASPSNSTALFSPGETSSTASLQIPPVLVSTQTEQRTPAFQST